MRRSFLLLFFATLALLSGPRALLAQKGPGGQFELKVIDRDTREPIACRMHLTNAGKRALKAPRVPFWHDHFVFDGTVTVKLPKGKYEFVIERGLEYLSQSGHFEMDNFSDDSKVIELTRAVDMAKEGWWSGDVDVARPAKDLELLMKADDLHVAQLITWPGRQSLLGKLGVNDPLIRFDSDRYIHLLAGIDARAGGTLLLFNLQTPLDLKNAQPEFPSQLDTIASVRQVEGWVDVQKAYSWDLPVWIATGGVDSIQVLNSNLRRKEVLTSEKGGKPRPTKKFPGKSGNGRWSEQIYYDLLNCGLRIPPSAGSGSGEFGNPVGYNRMYVHVDGDFTYEKWWQSVRAGQVMVTNGPLIRPLVEGELPGHVFKSEAGSSIELSAALTLSTRDKISHIEIVQNGHVTHKSSIDELVKSGGRMPPLVFERSGWFLIRATAEVPETDRYAMTAPYYVEIGDEPRISKTSASFFLDWVNERMKAIKLEDPKELATVMKHHQQARAFWKALVEKANVE